MGAISTPDLKVQREGSQEHDENCSREEALLAEAVAVKGHRQCQETLPRAEGTWGRHTSSLFSLLSTHWLTPTISQIQPTSKEQGSPEEVPQGSEKGHRRVK